MSYNKVREENKKLKLLLAEALKPHAWDCPTKKLGNHALRLVENVECTCPVFRYGEVKDG
jgi:hypothetical protein